MTTTASGLSWLSSTPTSIYAPEQRTDDLREMVALVSAFVERDVMPVLPRLEAGELDHLRDLMQTLGGIGALAVEIPEEYGGLDLPGTVAAACMEAIAHTGGFSVTASAHSSIGTLPTAYFGTPEQKSRYLPKLASGEWIGAYALTEPEAGSDALNARTTAVLTADGMHYRLHGVKQFITNSAVAGLFTLFAKIDGKHFTGFLIEPGTPGLTLGAEEHKMGIRSSSTRQVILEDCLVPVENMLGEIGKGHHIALNVLNIARMKLAVAGVGSAKEALRLSAVYAAERHQFGVAIASFGLIKQKLAMMATRIYAAESAVYRLVGDIDALKSAQPDAPPYTAARTFAAECAMVKVLGTEVLDFVVDEGVQIHGGYGFLQDFDIERLYRDSRINRLFEGTNEINRLLAPTTLLRDVANGNLPDWPAEDAEHVSTVDGLKSLVGYLARKANEMFGAAVVEEQEVLGALGDIMIWTYALESATLRAEQSGDKTAALMVQLYQSETLARVNVAAEYLASRFIDDPELVIMLELIHDATLEDAWDTIAAQRELAELVGAREGYHLPAR